MALLALSLTAPIPTTADLTPQEHERNIESFEFIWKTVRDKHWDPRINGVDWQAVHDELRPQMEKADSHEKAEGILMDMLGRLKESHFGVLPASVKEQVQPEAAGEAAGSRDGVTGLDVRSVAGHVLITSLDEGSAAARLGIRPGWEILAVDGKQLAPVVSRVVQALQGSNMQAIAARSAILAALAGKPGTPAHLQLRNGQDQDVEMDVARVQPRGLRTTLGFLPPMYVWSESRKLDGPIAYLAFNLFMDPEHVMRTVSAAVTSCLDCKGFIIDVRGNPGGMGVMAMGVAGWFIEEKGRRLGTMRTRETSLNFVINPRAVTYRGPLAILVDGCSGSTAEIFAGGMKDLKRARIFGSRTAGAALPATFEKLPNGEVFMYAFANYVSEGGQPLEGHGVTPDVAIELSRESLLREQDPALKAAIDWIKSRGN